MIVQRAPDKQDALDLCRLTPASLARIALGPVEKVPDARRSSKNEAVGVLYVRRRLRFCDCNEADGTFSTGPSAVMSLIFLQPPTA